MNGIFFVLRIGMPRRDLPEHYGQYTTCYNRWSKNSIWETIMAELQRLADGDHASDDGNDGSAGTVRSHMVDNSSVRVHKHGAGALRDGEPPQIGLSRGGRKTKVHLGINENINEKAMIMSVFPTSDQAAMVIGDKAYDTDAVLGLIETAGATAVIASQSNRKPPRPLDRET